jgi:hypothetical protein
VRRGGDGHGEDACGRDGRESDSKHFQLLSVNNAVRSIARGDVGCLLSVCIDGARRSATLSKTGALRAATLGPMDTIASRWQLIFLETALLAVFTVAAYLMVALFAG